MRDNDRIDRVLRELGTAEAPEGMHRRLTLALKDRLTARADSRAGAWRPVRLLLGGVGALCVLVLLITPGVLQRPDLPASGKVSGEAPIAPARPAAHAQSRYGTREGNGMTVVRASVHGRTSARARIDVSVRERMASREETELADASYAPTLVAPPEPITRQEQLLLRVAHHGGEEERAVLDPRVRDAQMVAEKAEVDAFFKPPELPKQNQ